MLDAYTGVVKPVNFPVPTQLLLLESKMFVSSRRSRWNIFCFAAVALVLAGLVGCGAKQIAEETADVPSGDTEAGLGTVIFEFDFGDGRVETVTVEGVGSEATVLDCLKKVKQPEVVVNGSGQNAFVSSIGDLTTAAGEGWSYRVNDQWADRSVGVYEVQSGDKITWTYGGFEPQE